MNWKSVLFCSLIVLSLSLECYAAEQAAKVSLQPGTFSAEVSGHVHLKFSGKAHVFRSPGGDWGIQLIKPQEGDTPVTSVLIMLPAKTQAGTHKLGAYEEIFDGTGKVTGAGATFSSPEIVCLKAEGTLNLTSAGPEFSGNFQFTAQAGFDASQKLTVQGEFHKLPIQK